MKKRTLFASTVAMIAAGIMGAVSPNPIERAANAQVEEKNQQASSPAKDEQKQAQTRQTRPSMAPMAQDFGKYLPHAVGYQHFQKQRAWCSAGSGGFNKVRHGRTVRRKHRRA